MALDHFLGGIEGHVQAAHQVDVDDLHGVVQVSLQEALALAGDARHIGQHVHLAVLLHRQPDGGFTVGAVGDIAQAEADLAQALQLGHGGVDLLLGVHTGHYHAVTVFEELLGGGQADAAGAAGNDRDLFHHDISFFLVFLPIIKCRLPQLLSKLIGPL